MTRTETDFIGPKDIPSEAFYGIHSVRAQENFPDTTPFNKTWYRAVGLTKLAVYQTYQRFLRAISNQSLSGFLPIRLLDEAKVVALETAAREVSQGKHFDQFIVPAIQGGAGTSINLNVNEVITNRALEILGEEKGNYEILDPIEDANVYQSTNDVIPTALTVASMELLNDLENGINQLRQRIERYESDHRDSLRIAYTQLQAAVPSTFGKLFSAYNDALSRDWWRVSKCFERIKVVNLSGSAIGTSVAVPRFFVMELVPTLQKLTSQPISRGENLIDTTSNLDGFVEVHGILKAHAVNLEKIVNDLRLLSSDLRNVNEMTLPKKQVGSSIMPAKVNPVIPEFVISAIHKVYANDGLIAQLAGQGMLELNAYLPTIGHALLESLELLIAANKSIREHIFDALIIDKEAAHSNLLKNPSICTALSPYVGYHSAAKLAKLMTTEQIDIAEANNKLNIIDEEKLRSLLSPANLLKAGFSIKDIEQ